MKSRITFLTAFLITIVGFAQQGINYKAIIKDNVGNVIANNLVTVQFIIYEGDALTNNVYEELHTPTTNANGMVILNIGEGTEVSGDYNTVDWAGDNHFLNVQVNTGAGLVDLGTTQFMATPYSLHAKTAESITGIKTISYASDNGPQTGLDSGQITSRVLTINKKESNTAIRISYTDNLRTLGTNNACRWEIRVDGVSSAIQPLVYDFFTGSDNQHHSRTLVGYFKGLSAGTHEIQIWVGSSPGYANADCYTGWNNSTWVIEAEEVN